MKKRFIVLGVLVAGIGVLASGVLAPPDILERAANYVPAPQQTDPCQAVRETPPKDMKRFWLGIRPYEPKPNFDYQFYMPRAYFNNRGGSKMADKIGRSDGAILFHARYPDFAPYNVSISREHYYSPYGREKDPKAWIDPEIALVWGGRQRDGILPTDWLKPENIEQLKYRFKRQEGSPEGWRIDEVPSPYGEGLLELDPDLKYSRGYTSISRYFIYRDERGVPTDQIVCKLEGFPDVACDHRFVYGDIYMRLGYDGQYLQDWLTLKRDSIKLFTCAIAERGPRPGAGSP